MPTFQDQEFHDIQAKVEERAAVPSVWRNKLTKLLTESPYPLLAEGECINYPLPEMASLRKWVTRANEWVDSANAFIVRKAGRKQSCKSRGGRNSEGATTVNGDDMLVEKSDHSLDELHELLREVKNLFFDCPEIATLQNVSAKADDVAKKVEDLLKASNIASDREDHIHQCRDLEGASLNIGMEELAEIEKIVNPEQLAQEL
ncbi:hypothetical protein ONZ45_g10704 [Pleurotus djamor]|nr:hypothetical protein ONZ45_g10704 [Pleurotus djamor]